MIGHSLIVFQRGNNVNELHKVNSWNFSFMQRSKKADESILNEAKNKKWKPDDIVNDNELKKIVYATNCINPEHEGYHKLASDGVHIINLSDDPNLYNPAQEKIEKIKAANKIESYLIKRLRKEFILELIKLKDAIPTGKIEIKMMFSLNVSVKYGVHKSVDCIEIFQNDKKIEYVSQIIDKDQLVRLPEMENIVNCPYRKAYHDRCQEISDLLGLEKNKIFNDIYVVDQRMKNPSPAEIPFELWIKGDHYSNLDCPDCKEILCVSDDCRTLNDDFRTLYPCEHDAKCQNNHTTTVYGINCNKNQYALSQTEALNHKG